MDTSCPGCGKRLKNLKEWETHAKRCKEWAKVIELSYQIPVVSVRDLTHLEVRSLPNLKDWAIWNTSANDWVRDKNGQIDSRVFPRNIQTLLSSVVAASIIAGATEPNDT